MRTPWTNSLSFNWSGTGFSTSPLKNPVPTINLSTQSVLALSDADAPDIVFGGPLAENTVIRAYTGNGFAAGWLSVMLYTKPNTYPTTTDYDVLKSSSNFDNSYTAPYNFRTSANDLKIREFSFNKFNYYNTLLHKGMLPVLTMYLTQAITHRTLMVVYLLRYLIIIWRTLPVQHRGR